MPWIGAAVVLVSLILLGMVMLDHYIKCTGWERSLSHLAQYTDESSVRAEFNILEKREENGKKTKMAARFLLCVALLGLAIGIAEMTLQ